MCCVPPSRSPKSDICSPMYELYVIPLDESGKQTRCRSVLLRTKYNTVQKRPFARKKKIFWEPLYKGAACRFDPISQQMEGAKNGFLVVSKVFFDLYTPQKHRKHDTSLDFAAFFKAAQKWPQKVPQKANFDKKNWRKNAASCAAAKTPQNLTKCRVCGAYKWQKKITKSVYYVVGLCVGYICLPV